MNAAAGRPHGPVSGIRTALWLLAAAILCAGFVLLGNWQLRRLSWKLKLIHDVSTRVHAPPQPAPGPASWPDIRAGHLQYLHVRLTGRFLAQPPALVHGTSPEGYGYWVMAPFQTASGFTVLVNRGYAPASWGDPSASGKLAPPANVHSLTGLLRFTEPKGGFLRPNRPSAGQWYSRDAAAIGQAQSLPAGQLAPYFVDEDASPGSARWPAGGLTKIQFRNAHLGYAITWYGMALAVLVGAGVGLYRSRKRKTPREAGS